MFKGALTDKPRLRSGVEFALVALGAAALGWTAGKLFASVGAPLP